MIYLRRSYLIQSPAYLGFFDVGFEMSLVFFLLHKVTLAASYIRVVGLPVFVLQLKARVQGHELRV